MNSFDRSLERHSLTLERSRLDILQVNLGKLCNLTCVHCHVEAGPTKTLENMSRETAEAVVRMMDQTKIHTLDLTGGAPELNPNFRYLVREASCRNIHVIDRCNLTVLFEPDQDDLAQFLADQQVEIVASLPCYSRENVDRQRGDGTFEGSILGLQALNRLGYGKTGSLLELNLVYNPVGPYLPLIQQELEKDYKERLQEDFGIVFNRLYAIANMPITRYAKYLKAFGHYDDYKQLLLTNFNPATVEGLMCRNTLSVSWDGFLYDCDFNQMLDMKIKNGRYLTIYDFKPEQLVFLRIQTGEHCFGCTAGAGSSCQGSLKV